MASGQIQTRVAPIAWVAGASRAVVYKSLVEYMPPTVSPKSYPACETCKRAFIFWSETAFCECEWDLKLDEGVDDNGGDGKDAMDGAEDPEQEPNDS